MKKVSEKTERLMVRHLDGEITADEQLELDRELVRSPDARAMFESYKSIDALSARVIAACAGRRDGEAPLLVVPRGGIHVAGPARRRSWMVYAGALAACLALAILWRTPEARSPLGTSAGDTYVANGGRSPVTTGGAHQRPMVGMPGAVPAGDGGVWDAGVWPVSDTPAPRVSRITDRNVILVPGEDGNYYLLNIDQIRQLKQTTRQYGNKFTRDPI